MIIRNITLYNYCLYKGSNTINFNQKDGKNIFLISGENGFGKTTFLHSLLWCLYGKMIGEIEETYKRVINSSGYSTLLKNNLNRDCLSKLSELDTSILDEIRRKGYSINTKDYQSFAKYSVAIEFADVNIPSIKCRTLKVIRSYDYILDKETISVFIDGTINELAAGIGPDVFINDFILSRDIARFFFFDSEKIVDVAETNTPSQRRKLCSAYNEVLGVKKYEDLKINLENLRLKFRKKSTDINLRNQLNGMLDLKTKYQQELANVELSISEKNKALDSLKVDNDALQLKLLKEGSGMSIDELNRQELLVKTCIEKNAEYKKQLKTFLEYSPFAIAGKALLKAKDLICHDYMVMKSNNSAENQNNLIDNITVDFVRLMGSIKLPNDIGVELQSAAYDILSKYRTQNVSDESLITLTKDDYNEFMSIYQNIISTYRSEFERLADDYKKNKQIWERAARKVSNMKNNESDEIIKGIRLQKNNIEKEIAEISVALRDLHENYGVLVQNISKNEKDILSLSKKVSLDDNDLKKDKVAEKLISELDQFLKSLRLEKKSSLEHRIQKILNNLMHKEDFIGGVKVITENDEMDIELYTSEGQLIRKDSLSKGEQQLYATSILKALVDESGVQFPVFIDSPLQKFDKSHANKIITYFYPSISKQVVLFPLLYKELSFAELDIMKPMVNSSYLIKNKDSHSFFEEVNVNNLM